MDIIEREEFEKYANSKTPSQFAMTTKAEVFSAGYRAALEAAGVRELVEALEKIAGEHMEIIGYCQSECDMVPDLTRHEMQRLAQTELARYKGK